MSPEAKVVVEVDGRQLSLSNLSKVLYPETGFTKGEVIDYYTRIAPVMLPHIVDRPVTLKRFPDGVDGISFFEKNVSRGAPDWVKTLKVTSVSTRRDSGIVEHPLIRTLPDLVWAANLAALEIHVPMWKAGRGEPPRPPDLMVFDLDPGPPATIVECCQVALWVEELLQSGGMTGHPKTSGSKGMQLYVRMRGRPTWDSVKDLAHSIAQRLEKEHPGEVVSRMAKDLRPGKVFIDWSQNVPSKTTVAPYSLRARPTQTVSTPIAWDEVRSCADGGSPAMLSFLAGEVLQRVEAHGDLFAGLLKESTKPG